MDWGFRAHASQASEQGHWPLCSYREARAHETFTSKSLCSKQAGMNGAGELGSGKPILHPSFFKDPVDHR